MEKQKKRYTKSNTLKKLAKIFLAVERLNTSYVHCAVRVLTPTETISTVYDVTALDFADTSHLTARFLFATTEGIQSLKYDHTAPSGTNKMSISTPSLSSFKVGFD
jgi:hypothetical protein